MNYSIRSSDVIILIISLDDTEIHIQSYITYFIYLHTYTYTYFVYIFCTHILSCIYIYYAILSHVCGHLLAEKYNMTSLKRIEKSKIYTRYDFVKTAEVHRS